MPMTAGVRLAVHIPFALRQPIVHWTTGPGRRRGGQRAVVGTAQRSVADRDLADQSFPMVGVQAMSDRAN